MRFLVLLISLLNTFAAQAQFDKKIAGPIKTSKGLELKEGDTLQLGRGTGFDGSFQYVQTGVVAGLSSNDPLLSTHANSLVIIRAFKPVRVGQGTKMYASLKAGLFYPAFADIESAIDAKEIVAINGQEIGKPRAKAQSAAENTLTASAKSGPVQAVPKTAGQDGMTVKPFSNDVDVRILSIDGNKSQQTVTVNFVLKTELPHQKISLLALTCNGSFYGGEGKAYDSDGTEYALRAVSLGNVTDRYVANKLPTSVPLKGSISFSNILPSVGMLSFVTISMSTGNYDGGANCQGGNVEVRNAKINWK